MTVVDASVLIPLSRVDRLGLLRDLFGTVTTVPAVQQEVVVQGRGRPGALALESAFEQWIRLEEVPPKEAERLAAAEGLEPADAALLLLAKRRREPLVANDARLVAAARAHGVEVRWVTSLLMMAQDKGLLDAGEATRAVLDLARAGMALHPEVLAAVLLEIERRGGRQRGGT